MVIWKKMDGSGDIDFGPTANDENDFLIYFVLRAKYNLSDITQ